MSDTTALEGALAGLSNAVRAGRTLLVALDFDGVLAPLVDVPSRSRATPEGAAALRRLSGADGVRLALISGRGLADLAAVAEVPDGTLLVGSHGAEVGAWDGGLRPGDPALDDEQSSLLARAADELSRLVEGTTARIEVKPTTVVLHTRGVPTQDTDRLVDAALALGERLDLDTMAGRDIVELSVLRVTKGDALRELRSGTGAGPVLFAGDDVTDERAMAVLGPGDVAIRVGDGESVAPYRVADPEAMARTLHRLADLLGS
ncbi:trehalose-phosphatase [Isoptericola sp. b441]|uniref:Trehalose 6-phosphate phosphatase n=1 Tax=Actinotalea lenta TaxID=3064654 RepID=A0ABT9D714_9CELL|nr:MULTISPECIES: trehalose-phosphatase [unclassified Isoptericola]MDO8106637.1 trehalose-phosphatase [Isoptericola sp. b441]MDO8121655.1 trehalose-phosphatase [Isoptericola sp. b490]